jgi:hypothetical protein
MQAPHMFSCAANRGCFSTPTQQLIQRGKRWRAASHKHCNLPRVAALSCVALRGFLSVVFFRRFPSAAHSAIDFVFGQDFEENERPMLVVLDLDLPRRVVFSCEIEI